MFLTFQETARRHPVNTSADSPLDFVVVDDRRRAVALAELRLARNSLRFMSDLRPTTTFTQLPKSLRNRSWKFARKPARAGRAITDRDGHPAKSGVTAEHIVKQSRLSSDFVTNSIVGCYARSLTVVCLFQKQAQPVSNFLRNRLRNH